MLEIDRFAGVFHALADETRQQILILLEERDRCVNELVSQFRVSQPTISKHLAVLRQANLVFDMRDGRRVCYSLNREYLVGCFDEFCKQFGPCNGGTVVLTDADR